MFYLAQIESNQFLDQFQLRLLARQENENQWAMMTKDTPLILLGKGNLLPEKLLVLVELSPNGDVEKLKDATPWVLNLVESYLTSGITPAYLEKEAERAEEWRQNLTLQSQDLGRRALELEARREQIQALEESRQRDKDADNSEDGNSVEC